MNQTEDEIKILSENVEQVKDLLKTKDNVTTARKNQKGKKTKKNNEPVVIIVPKEVQTADVTKQKVMSVIDPVIVPITNLRSAAKGSIILEGKTKNDVEQIKKCTEDKYDIKVTQLRQPQIKIRGISEKLTTMY